MADGMSISHSVGRMTAQMQAAQSAQLAAAPTSPLDHARTGIPGLALVPLPPRAPGEALQRPKRPANPLSPPRTQMGGASPLATASVGGAADGAHLLGESPHDPVDERAPRQGRSGSDQLPARAGLVGYARTNGGSGALVFLESERWHNHIRPHHITDPPTARGKRTTTWWPVLHSATGAQTMNDAQVVGVIMDAVRDGHWQNAPRGTVLSVYELPAAQAQQYGVSEVKVSAAPDGRILSAYPSRGDNVLAVREISPDEQQAPQPAGSTHNTDKLFNARVANTSFG